MLTICISIPVSAAENEPTVSVGSSFDFQIPTNPTIVIMVIDPHILRRLHRRIMT